MQKRKHFGFRGFTANHLTVREVFAKPLPHSAFMPGFGTTQSLVNSPATPRGCNVVPPTGNHQGRHFDFIQCRQVIKTISPLPSTTQVPFTPLNQQQGGLPSGPMGTSFLGVRPNRRVNVPKASTRIFSFRLGAASVTCAPIRLRLLI